MACSCTDPHVLHPVNALPLLHSEGEKATLIAILHLPLLNLIMVAVHGSPIATHPNYFQIQNAGISPQPLPVVHIEVNTFHFLILYFVHFRRIKT